MAVRARPDGAGYWKRAIAIAETNGRTLEALRLQSSGRAGWIRITGSQRGSQASAKRQSTARLLKVCRHVVPTGISYNFDFNDQVFCGAKGCSDQSTGGELFSRPQRDNGVIGKQSGSLGQGFILHGIDTQTGIPCVSRVTPQAWRTSFSKNR